MIFRCLSRIINTAKTDQITHHEYSSKCSQECVKCALLLKAGCQLSEGVNMARKVTVMHLIADITPKNVPLQTNSVLKK